MRPAVYVNFVEDHLVTSLAAGGTRTFVITPKKYWGMGFNLQDFLAGLQIKSASPNVGVTLKWQWSLDGRSWNTGATVVTEKTGNGDYTGTHATESEQTPFVRLIAEVRATAGSTQETADVSVWGYYRFRV